LSGSTAELQSWQLLSSILYHIVVICSLDGGCSFKNKSECFIPFDQKIETVTLFVERG
jgi:hypothetical protein